MKYPAVIGERETLDRAAAGVSLARFGDGEFKLALGKDCVSQKASPALAKELRAILAEPAGPGVLVCLPNVRHNGKGAAWDQYGAAKYADLLGPGPFGSAFITRPDSAPWIDTPDYWEAVTALWAGKHVILGLGTERSLRRGMLGAARSVTEVWASRHRDAYEEINRLEPELIAAWEAAEGPKVMLLCLGACATVLAWRLGKRGIHALDLGHIGMFQRHAGAYRYTLEDLISPAYRAQCQQMHARKWGADGAKHLAPVLAWADALKAETVLDYGCGEGRLSEAAKPVRRILNFDPGMDGKSGLPKPVDLVVCTDVLEHVEPDKLDNVLGHLRRLAAKGAYLVIATRKAKAILPDGRNAHLIIQPASWWLDKLTAAGWLIDRADVREGRDLTAWLRA